MMSSETETVEQTGKKEVEATIYVYVRNTAAHEDVRMEKAMFANFEEMRLFKEQLKVLYGAIGCHEVKLLIELFPDEEDDE